MRKEKLYYDETPLTKEYLDNHYDIDEEETKDAYPDGSVWYHLWRNFHLIWSKERGVYAEDAPYLRIETVGDLSLLHRILKGK